VQLFGCTFSFAGILMKFSSASNRCGAEFIRRTPLALGYQLSAAAKPHGFAGNFDTGPPQYAYP
jgi:hypothetical protein